MANAPSRQLIRRRYELQYSIGENIIAESGATNADGTPRSWYQHASDQMEVAHRLICPDLPLEFWAGLVSITSPICTINENIRKVVNFIDTGVEPLWGKVLDAYETQFSRTGDARIVGSNGKVTQKTEPFRQSLICMTERGQELGYRPTSVIDRHMINAACDMEGVNTACKSFNDSCRYVCDAMAKDLGVEAYQIQQVVWSGWRSTVGKSDPFSWFTIGDYARDHVLTNA